MKDIDADIPSSQAAKATPHSQSWTGENHRGKYANQRRKGLTSQKKTSPPNQRGEEKTVLQSGSILKMRKAVPVEKSYRYFLRPPGQTHDDTAPFQERTFLGTVFKLLGLYLVIRQKSSSTKTFQHPYS